MLETRRCPLYLGREIGRGGGIVGLENLESLESLENLERLDNLESIESLERVGIERPIGKTTI